MIAAGIIDNGQRPKLAEWVRNRIAPQVDILYDTSQLQFKGIDIVPRVKYLVEQECDFLYLVENDDYYPENYIERMEAFRSECDFIGSDIMDMFHIKFRYWQFKTLARGLNKGSGLFTMGFKPEIFKDFNWPPDETRQLDDHICRFVNYSDHITKVWCNLHGAVAIKGHEQGDYLTTGPHGRFRGQIDMIDLDLELFKEKTDMSFYNLHYTD